MKKLILCALLAMGLTTVAHAQQATEVTGEVVSVRTNARTLTVRDSQTRQPQTYQVPESTRITIAGQEARLGYLRAGDRVTLRVQPGGSATQVSLPQPTVALSERESQGPLSTVTGEITNINSRTRTFTVMGDQSGESFTYTVPENTRISIGGQDTQFGRLRRGDEVVLRFRGPATDRQAARVRVPEPTIPLAQRNDQPPATAAGQAAPTPQLPRTASFLPLLAVTGLVAFVGAGLLRFRRRMNRSQ